MICPCCFEDIAVAHACKAPDANPANLNRIYAEMQRLHLQLQEAKAKALSDLTESNAVWEKKWEAAELQNGEWKKLVRGMVDRLYAIGKGEGDDFGRELMVIATELHRRCQVIKGEDPLPHAGEHLTEKRVGPMPNNGHTRDCMCADCEWVREWTRR